MGSIEVKEAKFDWQERLQKLSESCDREDRETFVTGLKFGHMAERMVAARRLDKETLSAGFEAMSIMVERDRQGELHGPEIGLVYTEGVNGIVTAVVYMPVEPSVPMKDKNGNEVTKLKNVVNGTPAIIQIRDRELAKSLKGKSYENRVESFRKSLRKKAQLVKEQQAAQLVGWGGWGSVPQGFAGRGRMILHSQRADKLKYEIATHFGFMGAMKTLNESLILDPKNAELRDKIDLSMYLSQVDDAIRGLARLEYDDERDIAEGVAKYCGHSMGGYLALAMGLRFTHTLLERIKDNKKTTIVDDKGVVVGAKYKGLLPDWMQQFVDSDNYRSCVPLQTDNLSFLVRLVNAEWWTKKDVGVNNPAFRKGLLGFFSREKTDVVGMVMEHYSSEQAAIDGKSISVAHCYAMVNDLLFMVNCVRLLDYASPIYGDQTQRMGEQDSRLSRLMRFLFGGADNILIHKYAGGLASGIGVQEGNTHWDSDGIHYMNKFEAAWAYDVASVE